MSNIIIDSNDYHEEEIYLEEDEGAKMIYIIMVALTGILITVAVCLILIIYFRGKKKSKSEPKHAKFIKGLESWVSNNKAKKDGYV